MKQEPSAIRRIQRRDLQRIRKAFHQESSPLLLCQSSMDMFWNCEPEAFPWEAFPPAIKDGGGVRPRCLKALIVSILPLEVFWIKPF